MFNSKTSSSFKETSLGSTTIIGAGTVITGNIESNSDIRIDGVLVGNITAKAKILIGSNGVVNGDVTCLQADISGKITGKIKVEELLQLRDKATIQGDIYAGKLQIEPTATFNGQCHMGANVVEFKTEINNAVNQ